jgi:hypothetical protein
MGLAAILCDKAKHGEGQIALKRLLNSTSAKLASTVLDGEWVESLYPKNGEVEIAAGLVWIKLGSPSAAFRWRAAHSIRSFARFGKWGVIDAIIKKFNSTDARPFQAPELPFYFLHARLWLLIAIARVAMDYPQNIVKYAELLKTISLDKNTPHILLRHFAAQALLTCASSGSLVLSEADINVLNTVNESPFPKIKSENYSSDSFYKGRLDSIPKPEFEFHMDYDFDKTEVTALSDMFDQSRWVTKDAITAWVLKLDPLIKSMYDNRGRSVSYRNRSHGMTTRYHVYGQQLAWHALHLVAGEFLEKYAVIQRDYDSDDRWLEWIRNELLTRRDGLWLSDGIDRLPVDSQVNLYEKGEKGLIITSDKTKLLLLLNIETSIANEIVVFGDWRSTDGIKIHITSALVDPRHAKKLAIKLSKEDPFQAWLPNNVTYDGYDENTQSAKEHFEPWIVLPSSQARLDETDPLGVNSTASRPHFTKAINAIRELEAQDPFKRTWADSIGRVAVRSEAWGRYRMHDEDEANSAERLVCSSDFLKDVLEERQAELLVLIILRRYEKGFSSRSGQFWHTMAVARISQSLDFEYYPGIANKEHVSNF